MEGAAVRKGRPSLAGELGFTVHHDLVIDSAIASCQLCTGPRRCHSCQQNHDTSLAGQEQLRQRRPQGSGAAAGASSAGPWNGQGETELDVELGEFRVLGHFPAADCSEAEVVCEA